MGQDSIKSRPSLVAGLQTVEKQADSRKFRILERKFNF